MTTTMDYRLGSMTRSRYNFIFSNSGVIISALHSGSVYAGRAQSKFPLLAYAHALRENIILHTKYSLV